MVKTSKTLMLKKNSKNLSGGIYIIIVSLLHINRNLILHIFEIILHFHIQ